MNQIENLLHLPTISFTRLSSEISPIVIQCTRTSSSIVKEHNDPDMFISDLKNPYEKEKKVCIACKYKIPFDYKNPRLLSQFISSYTGLMYDKHITGLCDAQQRRLKTAIKKSRNFGYMPFHIKAPQYLKDPKLFDPFKPSRPNPY